MAKKKEVKKKNTNVWMDNPKYTQLLIWGIPKRVKEKFKQACAKESTSMRQTIIQFMREFIERAGL